MSSQRAIRGNARLGALALSVLFAAGIVLALSWVVRFPEAVLVAAWCVALAAMVTVIVHSYRESRRTETSLAVAVGRSFKELGRFIFWFL